MTNKIEIEVSEFTNPLCPTDTVTAVIVNGCTINSQVNNRWESERIANRLRFALNQRKKMKIINKDRNWTDREMAVKVAGEQLVSLAENENCENSMLVTDGTEYAGYEIYEAVMDNDTHRVTIIFLQDAEKTKNIPLDEMEWKIEGYKTEEL